MRVTLSLGRRDGTGAFDWMELDMEQLPLPQEAIITPGDRVFVVVQRTFRVFEGVKKFEGIEDVRPQWTEAGLLLQQVGGPAVIEPPTPAEIRKIGGGS